MACGKCNFKTPLQLSMDNHRFTKHGIGWGRSPFHCPFCPYNVYQWGRMEDHLTQHENISSSSNGGQVAASYEALLPGGGTISWQEEEEEQYFRGPRRKVTDRTVCSMCETRFDTGDEMKAHLNRVHLAVGPPYPCPACDFSTSIKFNLPQHYDICHRKVNDYFCTECDFVTYAKPYLRNHEKAMHEGYTLQKSMKCPQCHFRTNTRYCLEDHLRRKHYSVYSAQVRGGLGGHFLDAVLPPPSDPGLQVETTVVDMADQEEEEVKKNEGDEGETKHAEEEGCDVAQQDSVKNKRIHDSVKDERMQDSVKDERMQDSRKDERMKQVEDEGGHVAQEEGVLVAVEESIGIDEDDVETGGGHQSVEKQGSVRGILA